MNKLQTIFFALTGFEASYKSRSAEAEGWESWDASTLVDVVENLDLGGIDSMEAEKLHSALTEFKDCDSGCGVDLDNIFNSL